VSTGRNDTAQTAQVRDLVQPRPALEPLARGNAPRQHDTGARRGDLNIGRHHARPADLLDLHRRHPDVQQAVPRLLNDFLRSGDPYSLTSRLALACGGILGDEIRLDDGTCVRRRKGCEPLILRDDAARGDVGELLDEPVDADVDLVKPRLVRDHVCEQPKGLAAGLPPNRAHARSDQPLLLGADGHHALVTVLVRSRFRSLVDRHERHAAVGSGARFVRPVGRMHRIDVVQRLTVGASRCSEQQRNGAREPLHPDHSTIVQANIIAWSSCARLWQWATYGPTNVRKLR
jgi:hypothetical protein